MRCSALQVTVVSVTIVTLAACGDPPGGQNHDAAVSVPDVPPDVDAQMPDAPPACGSVALGTGIRPAVAHAAGHFAIAYLAVGPVLGVAQFTEAGTAAGTATAAVPMISAVPPAIAGRVSFLIAYLIPDGSVGLAALAPGGALSAPVVIAATQVGDLHLAASPIANEYALTYSAGTAAKFARIAADGTIIAGPVDLPERVVGVAYRTGGWALVTRPSGTTQNRLVLADDNGAVGTTAVDLPANVFVAGVAWSGSELALTMWDVTKVMRLRRFDAAGTMLGQDAPLSSNVEYPGGLAAGADGFTVSLTTVGRDVHVVHATAAGTVDSDHVLGSNGANLEFPSIASAPSGVRAAAWQTSAPAAMEVRFARDCP